MNNNRKRIHLLGFTLSETIIVLVSLGIISAIVIPQIIHKYQATQSRMKIKKAMSLDIAFDVEPPEAIPSLLQLPLIGRTHH